MGRSMGRTICPIRFILKKKKQAQVAVMRKLLHAIWGMFTYDEPWNGEKFHPSARQAEGEPGLDK